jgi:hypothetical protein
VNEEPNTRQRDLALQAGRVAYRAEHGRWPSRSWKLPPPVADTPYYKVTFTKAAPPPAPPAPSVPLKSPEREAWDRAYAGSEQGPVGGSWPEDGRHIPYMRWRLPYSPAR